MATQKVAQKPRSPTTDRVFEAFVARLRAEPLIGEAAADRMHAALSPGQTVNAKNLQDALFPAEDTATE